MSINTFITNIINESNNQQIWTKILDESSLTKLKKVARTMKITNINKFKKNQLVDSIQSKVLNEPEIQKTYIDKKISEVIEELIEEAYEMYKMSDIQYINKYVTKEERKDFIKKWKYWPEEEDVQCLDEEIIVQCLDEEIIHLELRASNILKLLFNKLGIATTVDVKMIEEFNVLLDIEINKIVSTNAKIIRNETKRIQDWLYTQKKLEIVKCIKYFNKFIKKLKRLEKKMKEDDSYITSGLVEKWRDQFGQMWYGEIVDHKILCHMTEGFYWTDMVFFELCAKEFKPIEKMEHFQASDEELKNFIEYGCIIEEDEDEDKSEGEEVE